MKTADLDVASLSPPARQVNDEVVLSTLLSILSPRRAAAAAAAAAEVWRRWRPAAAEVEAEAVL